MPDPELSRMNTSELNRIGGACLEILAVACVAKNWPADKNAVAAKVILRRHAMMSVLLLASFAMSGAPRPYARRRRRSTIRRHLHARPTSERTADTAAIPIA